MEHFLLWVLNGVFLIGGWELGKEMRRRRNHPFRWKCPICAFKVTTSDENIYRTVKRGHYHEEA